MTVEAGGQVLSTGSQHSGEAVNPEGSGNTIFNYGTIRSSTGAAIWFQNTSGTNTVINGPTGVIQAPGNVMGASGNGAVDFTNQGTVIGNLIFAGGDDVLHLYTGSSISGSIDGGGGTNAMTLNGTGSATLPGAVSNFETLTKQDAGTWTLTGSIGNNGGGTPLAVEVQDGTLILTGNNTNFNGTMLVDPPGVLQAPSQSLPPAVTDNGQVQFTQVSAGTYSGLISGTGAVVKLDSGTLTLAPSAAGGNTYTGGTYLDAGIIAVSADNALGAPDSGLTFNGGTLQFTSPFDLAVTRPITLNAPGGTIDTDGNNTTITQGITGTGPLTKAGAGTLVLAGDSTYTGGTAINAGTLQLGNGGTSGSIIGDVVDSGALAFDRSDTMTFRGVISGSGTVTQAGTGTTVLTGNNTYTGDTTISAGTLQLGNGGTSGSIIGDVADSGTLAFERSDTVAFSGTISGSGGLAQIGTGTTVLNANDTYTGPTNVVAGTLVVGDASHASAALSGGGTVIVANGATLGGFGSIAGSVIDNGTIAVGNALPAFSSGPDTSFSIGGNLTNSGLVTLAGTTPGNTLRVGGNYADPGGTLVLRTELNAGGPLTNQFTDRLLVSGNASGSTAILVNATGSSSYTAAGIPTATDGTSLVQVAGTSSPDAFSLPGGYVSGGTPYQYHLYAYGPGSPNGAAAPSQNLIGNPSGYWDYRLQDAYVAPSGAVSPLSPADPVAPADARLEVDPQIPAYITVPTALFNAGFQDLDELHRRLGEIRDAQQEGYPQRGEVFLRAYGGIYNYTSTRGFDDYGFNSSQDYSALQFGGSAIALNNSMGTLRVGLAGILGRLWFQPSAVDGSSKGLFNSERLAAIATYQARAGWYLDGIVAGGLLDGTVSTAARGETTGLNGTSFAVSLEGGYPMSLGWHSLVAEPELQLAYQHLHFGSRTDADGLDVNIGGQDQGIARVGGRLARQFAGTRRSLVTPYVEANLLQGFGDGGDVDVSGVGFGTGQYGTALQVGGGVTGTLMSRLAIYSEVLWRHQVGNGGFRGWSFNGGLRYDF